MSECKHIKFVRNICYKLIPLILLDSSFGNNLLINIVVKCSLESGLKKGKCMNDFNKENCIKHSNKDPF